MTTNRERIIHYLQTCPEGVDDDNLALALGFRQRQQANSICRKLMEEGLVSRRLVYGKIHNFWVGSQPERTLEKVAEKRALQFPALDATKDWFWEGNVQAQVIKYLVSQNFSIRSVADTGSKQRGVDIIADRGAHQVWISVKGYPKGTERTQPSTQAGHWFKDAVFDVIRYRGENKSVKLGVALPDFPRYHSLAKKIAWLKPVANFVYFWVSENGDVKVE